MNVLIADDHPLVRDALARTVQQLSPEVRVSQAGDLEGLLHLAAQGDADLALVDLNMPGMDGLAGLRRLREVAPTLPVVVASGQEDAATIRAVLAAGAVGFIPKSERSEVLLGALRLVQSGAVYVPARLLDAAPPAPAPAVDVGADAAPARRAALSVPRRAEQGDRTRAGADRRDREDPHRGHPAGTAGAQSHRSGGACARDRHHMT